MGHRFPALSFAGKVIRRLYHSVDKAGHFEGRGRLVVLLPSVR